MIGDNLSIENVTFESLANEFGTPCYVYSNEMLINEFHSKWN